MCDNENSAPLAQEYLNAQLAALFENARKCVSRHDTILRPSDHQKYSVALAEYTYGKHREVQPSNDDLMFYASFGTPRIEFICNHDAIIHLTLQEGHYNLQFANATETSSATVKSNRLFKQVTASFRMSFSLLDLPGDLDQVGGGSHVIRLFVFNFKEAKLSSIVSEEPVDEQALSSYLLHYLGFLSKAGRHVLFSLPDFDDDSLSIDIDFSLISNTNFPVDEVQGISVKDINVFLSTAWLTATLLVDSGKPYTDVKVALAEFRSTSIARGTDIHFRARMGPPRIKAICGHEVIVYLTIEELFVHDSSDLTLKPTKSFSNWEIAFLVDVDTSDEFKIVLDTKTARLAPNATPDGDSEVALLWARIADSFSFYFFLLESSQSHIIYHRDSRWIIGGFGAPPIDSLDGTGEEHISGGWSQISDTVEMSGFDQITAISQSAINAYFSALWSTQSNEETSLIQWSYEDYFRVTTFKPLSVRLLSNGRAIVWVRLQDGFLKTLPARSAGSEVEQYEFQDWSLSFEVDIKISDHDKLQGVTELWNTRFKSSDAYKAHGQHGDRVLRHIYLDLRSAEFLPEFSNFGDLLRRLDERPMDKIKAVITFIRKNYFDQITSLGHHILHSVPVWNTGATPPFYGLTDVEYHVYSKQVIERYTWSSISRTDEPVIILLGMTGFRPLPARVLRYTANWTLPVARGTSYGTVAFSKRVILQENLLTLLARVNALTTIVPTYIDSGTDWKLELTTWAEHATRKVRTCDWVFVGHEAGALKYKWEVQDGWSYTHQGSGDLVNGSYVASCDTKNYLYIPTTFSGSLLGIKLEGSVAISVSYKGSVDSWISQSSAHWSTTLAIKSGSSGIQVEIIDYVAPVFRIPDSFTGGKTAMSHADLQTLLKAHLPAVIDLTAAINEIKSFEGSWNLFYTGLSASKLINPIFNAKGDLLFNILPDGVLHATSLLKSASVQSPGRTSFGNGGITQQIIGSGVIRSRPSLGVKHSRSTSFRNGSATPTFQGFNGSAYGEARTEDDRESVFSEKEGVSASRVSVTKVGATIVGTTIV